METIAQIDRKNLRSAIVNTNGAFFGISFIKKDGSLREMVARTKVTKHLSNGKNTTKHIDKYITCYDVRNGYRNINLETVQTIKIRGTKYIVQDQQI